MFANIRITHRFIAVVVIFSAAMWAVIAVSYWGQASARDSIKTLHDDAMQPALLADQSIDKLVQNRVQVLLAFQHAPDGPLVSVHEHPTTLHIDTIGANRTEADRLFKLMESTVANPEEKALLEAAKASCTAWRGKLDQAVKAINDGDFSPATMAAFLKAGREEGEAAVKALQIYRDHQVKQAQEAYAAAQDQLRTALIMFALIVLIGATPATLLTLTLLTRMRLGFKLANESAAAIADGDLTHVVPHTGRDEIGKLLFHMETMRSKLQHVIGQVRSGSDSIANASTEVATGTLDLSRRTEEQASSLEKTASASEELTSTVQNNADNAAQANQLASSASSVASRGGAVVAQVVNTMEAINSSSRKIVDIIAVIDGIAFQTNILALNAAVEAARAGEQGRGFAVVAAEVRSLAHRSAEAAKEIKTLISDSVQKVGVGTAQVTEAGATMQEIVTGIQRVADIVGEIALASREQSAGIAQINQAVTHLDGVTQQNAALVEQTSAASNALQDQARELAVLAASFKLEQHAGTGSTGRPPSLRLR